MLSVLGLSSSASENPPERYSSSDVTSAICGWYDAGADGDVMDLECRPGRIGMLAAIVKAPGFIALELASLDIDTDLSANPFWNDGLLDAWWRMGRICS